MTAISADFHQRHVSLVQDTVSFVGGAHVKGTNILIERDTNGYTHVTGTVLSDVAFGLGWAHARDRLFQMDFYRRIASGKLSEIVGERALDSDKYFRTMGLVQAGMNNYVNLTDDTKTWLSRYTEGVNTYISRYGTSNKPFETTWGNYVISSDWSVYDSMAILKLWQLLNSGNANLEMLRFYLATVRGLSIDRVMDLIPMTPNVTGYASFTPKNLDTPDAARAVYIRAEDASLAADAVNNKLLQASLGITANGTVSSYSAPTYGTIDDLLKIFDPATLILKHSNDWMGTGGYLFYASPLGTGQLDGLYFGSSRGEGFKTSTPNPVYAVHLKYKLSTGGASTFGPSIPGIPGLFEGQTSTSTWSISSMFADSMDWYVINGDSSTYTADGNTYTYTNRTETITVKDSAAVTITVRETVYGPILTDIMPAAYKYKKSDGNYVQMALQWTGNYKTSTNTDLTMDWVTTAWTLTDSSEFSTLTLKKLNNPPMNVHSYFKLSSSVQWFGAGKLPIRQSGHSGLFPAFSDGRASWNDFNSNIQAFKTFLSEKNYYVAANNRPVGYGFRYNFGYDFGYDYRARRLASLLSNLPARSPSESEIQAIVRDKVNVFFSEDLKPLLTKAIDGLTDKTSTVATTLASWDGSFDANSYAAVIAQQWYFELSRIAAAETGVAYWDNPLFVWYAFLPNYYYSSKNASEPVSSDTQTRNIAACVVALSTIYGVTADKTQDACYTYASKALQKVIDNYGQTKLSSYTKKYGHYLTESSNFNCMCARDFSGLGGSEFTIYQSGRTRPTVTLTSASATGIKEDAKSNLDSNAGFYYEQYISFLSSGTTKKTANRAVVPGGITGHQFDKGIYDYYMGPVLSDGSFLANDVSSYTVSSSQTIQQVDA